MQKPNGKPPGPHKGQASSTKELKEPSFDDVHYGAVHMSVLFGREWKDILVFTQLFRVVANNDQASKESLKFAALRAFGSQDCPTAFVRCWKAGDIFLRLWFSGYVQLQKDNAPKCPPEVVPPTDFAMGEVKALTATAGGVQFNVWTTLNTVISRPKMLNGKTVELKFHEHLYGAANLVRESRDVLVYWNMGLLFELFVFSSFHHIRSAKVWEPLRIKVSNS